MSNNTEKEVLEIFGFDVTSREPAITRTSVPSDLVRHWMISNDLDTLAALHYLLVDKSGARNVEPPFKEDELHAFTLRFYERCLLENRSDPGAWSATRYSAGWSIVNWFAKIWRSKSANKWAQEIKDWLAEMYRGGDDALRTCLVTATLEHLFENKEIARFFADWRVDPTLAEAYEQASEWRRKGGTSPLGSVDDTLKRS